MSLDIKEEQINPIKLTKEHYIAKDIVARATGKQTAPKDHLKEKKLDPSLLPMDVLIKYVVPAYQEGLQKYERESWRRGFHTSTLLAACQRHLAAYTGGEDYDPEPKEKFDIDKHHLGAAIFCLLSILHSNEHHPELDDRRDIRTGNVIVPEGITRTEYRNIPI